jgi:hypothetical protein
MHTSLPITSRVSTCSIRIYYSDSAEKPLVIPIGAIKNECVLDAFIGFSAESKIVA